MKINPYDLAIIGGGPAGMMAAISFSSHSPLASLVLLEKNKVLGKKLLLTGKGRCNLTNTKEIPEIVSSFGKNGEFLYSSLHSFSNLDLISFFETRGVKTKVEWGQRVFSADDKAYTFLKCLKEELVKLKVKINYNFKTIKISHDQGLFKIYNDKDNFVFAKKVILATGGKSYPETGSTGDGYKIAKKLGHSLLPLYPALAPLFIQNKNVRSLAGLTLKNIGFTLFQNNQELVKLKGDLLFTHQGISGPVVFKVTKIVTQALKKQEKVTCNIDLKPALTEAVLKKRIYEEIHQNPQKNYKNLLKTLLPRIIIPLAIQKTNLNPFKKSSHLTLNEVLRIIDFLKKITFSIDAVAPIDNAIVTSGGIPIKEIDSRTMQSKIVPNLYFAGEIIALDGPTGGYNLQKAFSTGYLAGLSCSS